MDGASGGAADGAHGEDRECGEEDEEGEEGEEGEGGEERPGSCDDTVAGPSSSRP